MKTLYSLALTLLTASLFAQTPCSDIFISEYVEGLGTNKAIELYNPTNSAITLTGYSLERFSNGAQSSAANQKLDLSTVTINAYETYVIALDKRNPVGTGQDAPIDSELESRANMFASPVYDDNNTMYFNGNDAMVLTKNGTQLVDVIGKIGENPGDNGWNDVAPTYTAGDAGPDGWTRDHTLIRKSSIQEGETEFGIPFFNPALEWDSLAANTFTNLGSHDCSCNPNETSVNKVDAKNSDLRVFPNPANEVIFVASKSNAAISSIEILDITGKTVANKNLLRGNTVDVSELPTGTYFIRANYSNNTFSSSLFLKK